MAGEGGDGGLGISGSPLIRKDVKENKAIWDCGREKTNVSAVKADINTLTIFYTLKERLIN